LLWALEKSDVSMWPGRRCIGRSRQVFPALDCLVAARGPSRTATEQACRWFAGDCRGAKLNY
jgi:hypothetical protein